MSGSKKRSKRHCAVCHIQGGTDGYLNAQGIHDCRGPCKIRSKNQCSYPGQLIHLIIYYYLIVFNFLFYFILLFCRWTL
jgi:hypothetical protein